MRAHEAFDTTGPGAYGAAMSSRRWLIRVVVLVVAMVAGCSSSEDDKDQNSGSGGSANESSNASACDTVSEAEIESALGLSSVGSPTVTEGGTVTVCTYTGVTIRYEKMSRTTFDNTPELYDSMFGPGTLTEVNGVGERAFTRTAANITELLAYSGTTSVQIDAPDVSLDQLTALMQLILAKL